MQKLILTVLMGLGIFGAHGASAYNDSRPHSGNATLAENPVLAYDGWIAFNSTINSFIVELQGEQVGVSGENWAALQFTNEKQLTFARAQFSSVQRPLLHIVGEALPATENDR